MMLIGPSGVVGFAGVGAVTDVSVGFIPGVSPTSFPDTAVPPSLLVVTVSVVRFVTVTIPICGFSILVSNTC
jgi:hypothetical protein